MKTIIKIAWRNVWRNPKRSLVMIIAIAVGLWGGIFAASMSVGMIQQRFTASIEQHISHIQIHNPEYLKDKNLENIIPNIVDIKNILSNSDEVKAYSTRTIINGMLASSTISSGINIRGIDPNSELQTTKLNDNIIEGTYFDEEMYNPILIGKKLADKTKLEYGSRLVITFQNQSGELVSSAFRVAGIFLTSNTTFDEINVYIKQEDLAVITDSELVINEIAIIATSMESIIPLADKLTAEFPELTVRTWAEISPDLSYMQEMTDFMLLIMIGIILLALAFGLVNTMLMAVFERISELGMLMAVGMNKQKVFLMILIETTFITIIGAIGGVILSLVSILIFGKIGIDFSKVGGDSLHEFGYDSVVYPHIEPTSFIYLGILVVLTALLATLFPAIKAIRLRPAEAVRID